MPPPQGFFSFPGIIAATDGRYQCGHGTAPGRIIIDAAYQDSPVLEVGDLTIGYGNQYFVVRDCKVQEQISYYDPGGH
ncbi:MAG TPA: hypothetical protein VLA12_05020, partial [Planctomycetaceae bacterium]|nr:hypothetical protein [Planctomycetaceae bacterium]